MAAKPLRALWRSGDHPSITWWTGPIDVVHGPNFQLAVEGLEIINPNRVLGFLRATMSGRVSGIDNDFPVTNIYDLANGKIKRVRVFTDRDAALKAAGLSE